MSEKVNRKKMRKAEEPMQLMHFDVIVVSSDRVDKQKNMAKSAFRKQRFAFILFYFYLGERGCNDVVLRTFFLERSICSELGNS